MWDTDLPDTAAFEVAAISSIISFFLLVSLHLLVPRSYEMGLPVYFPTALPPSSHQQRHALTFIFHGHQGHLVEGRQWLIQYLLACDSTPVPSGPS